jgi:hypothetical protein
MADTEILHELSNQQQILLSYNAPYRQVSTSNNN